MKIILIITLIIAILTISYLFGYRAGLRQNIANKQIKDEYYNIK